MKRIKLEGETFGRLYVKEYVGKSKYLCKCECGNEKVIRGDHLRGGVAKSCGCYNSEVASQRMKENLKDEDFVKKMNEGKSKVYGTEEFRKSISDGLRKKFEDEEYRQMVSNRARDNAKKQWANEEYRKKQKEIKSLNMKERWENQEYAQYMSNMSRMNWKNEEYRKTISNSSRISAIKQWEDEEYRRKHSGEYSHLWKGGKSSPDSIYEYLSKLPEVCKWKRDSKRNVGSKCEFTGRTFILNTHHIYSFSKIIEDAHTINGIEYKIFIDKYTDEEIDTLKTYIIDKHIDFTNAVVLCEEVHMLFHKLYRYGNNTPEQFEEFRGRYMAGEFEDILEEMFNNK